ncbi:5-hydroxytryptamine receptor 3A-like [Anabas testudineus]|uniref:5-hydroxytryptamine receptor 3A-like n=1 Tax=Anabas testudineus TaxID=64144 RepID=UPI000E4624CF|nr:5-hydroxytryptamine receptor 3A-like [Anabas testudineus]
MFLGFYFLLILTAADVESSEKVCSYQDVLNHLNLTKGNDLFSMTRPVKDHNQPTNVFLQVLLYAILDVREIDQTFIPYVWIFNGRYWENDYIRWDPEDFCGIFSVNLPNEILWKPDITIEEMIEKDKAPPSPLLTISSGGMVIAKNDQVLVSTCRMHVYKFPFDVQTCTLSFKSVTHSTEEMRLGLMSSSEEVTEWSREVMRTQYEWLFINMTVTNKTDLDQDVIVYTINMRRRSILYIVNFILPILFFLCLDLASFLISDRGGEKLSFKVTVLLAVTVMQLILNDILPSSSNKIPLIAAYCIGIFALMMLSLLETIVVMYLMEKDSSSEDNEANGDQDLSEASNNRSSERDEKSPELLKRSSSQLTEESHGLEKLSRELREALKILNQLQSSKKDEEKPGYWTRMTKKINKVFFIFYVTASSLFLLCTLAFTLTCYQHLSFILRTVQITMKRRPMLYTVNFLLPILLILSLDLASFLISDCGGEKLGFKGSSTQLMEDSHNSELTEVLKTLILLLNSK